MKLSYRALLVIGCLITSACSPVTKERKYAYRLLIEFKQNDVKRKAGANNFVEVGDFYDHAPGMSGPKNTCKANASAIVVPVKGGDIIALTDRQPGEHAGWHACVMGMIEPAEFNKNLMPRFIFVGASSSLKNAIEVSYDDLNRFGLDDVKVSIVDMPSDLFAPDQNILKRFGCAENSSEDRYTSEPPRCNSLVIRQLKTY